MQVSKLSVIQLLEEKLLEFPALVDSLKDKEYSFLEKLEIWMKETETILKNNNIAKCSTIAGYRGKIIAPLYDETRGRSAKKRQLHIAAESMYEIQSTVLSVIKPFKEKVNEATDLLNHLLVALKQSGAVKYTDGTDFQSFINKIWGLLANYEQVKPNVVKILTLVSQVDALRIIAELIKPLEWK